MQFNKSTTSFVKGISSIPTHADDIYLFVDQVDEKFKYVNSSSVVKTFATVDEIPSFVSDYALYSELVSVSGDLKTLIDTKLDTSVFAALSGDTTDLSNYLTTSEIAGLTGNLQEQIDTKLDTSVFAALSGTDLSSYATISYVESISSGLQNQIDTKLDTYVFAALSGVGPDLSNYLTISEVAGLTGNLQEQIDTKLDTSVFAALSGDTTDLSSYATISYVESISSGLQNQLNTLTKADITDFTESDYVHTTGNENIAGNKTFLNDVSVAGTFTVAGSAFQVNMEQVSTSDNIIRINDGEVGSGVTSISAGIVVDRGTSPDYFFVFDEISNTFRIGESSALQAVATRQDGAIDGGVAVWNDSVNMFETKTSFSLVGDISASSFYGDGSQLTGVALETTITGITGGLTQLDNRFVNVSGDTMTGELTIGGTHDSNDVGSNQVDISDGYIDVANTVRANNLNAKNSIKVSAETFDGPWSGGSPEKTLTITENIINASDDSGVPSNSMVLRVNNSSYITMTRNTGTPSPDPWEYTSKIELSRSVNVVQKATFNDTAYFLGNIQQISGGSGTATLNDTFINGDLTITGNISGGAFYGDGSNLTFNNTTVSISGSSQVIDSLSETSADACEWLVSVKGGGNLRASRILAAWNGSGSVAYTETSTTDIGDTSDAVFSVDDNATNIRLLLTSTQLWDIKTKRTDV